jgi:hypothetical protein
MTTVSMLCLVLSPYLDTLDVHFGVAWAAAAARTFCTLVLVACLVLPLFVATGPAQVSTAVDELKETLNACRLNDMTPEVHIKVAILEHALGNVNHGQGAGFKVLGVVIDKTMLRQIGAKLIAAATFAMPFVLAVYAGHEPDGGSAPASKPLPLPPGMCTLTPTQIATTKGLFLSESGAWEGGCAYNMSIADVLALE